MILPDIETKVDLLNAEPIAKTISQLIRRHPGTPMTIGVHGDWGAGKSSVLEMVEHAFAGDDKTLCVKFNGWRFQGFEDAKIALLEGLVTELVESRSLATKAGQAVKDIFRRLDLLKIAKNAGGLAFTAFTGIPTLDQLKSASGMLQGLLAAPEQLVSKGVVEGAASILSGALKEPDTKKVPQEVAEFRKEFDKLLELAGVDQLVVLVDDLDRCLPDTAIETLEAIRLFVFTPRTAFVIAADEGMIEYAVRRHFPDLPDTTVGRSYAQNYLEKLIHVPFRIPVLGAAETKVYVTLLLVGAAIPSNPEAVSKLIAAAREKLRRPWQGASLGPADLKATMTDIPDTVQQAFNLSEQLGPVLAEATFGNPRQIKRFLNLMLLRTEIAAARGIGTEIKGPVLAKLMLLERGQPRIFDQIAQLVNKSPTGVCAEIAAMEQRGTKSTAAATSTKGSAGTATRSASESTIVEEWAKSEAMVAWAAISPSLSDVDLRGYFFLARDRRGQMGAYAVNDRLHELATRLTGSDFALAAEESNVKSLPLDQAEAVFELLRQRIISSGSFNTKPNGVSGLVMLVKHNPTLQGALVDFLESLPKEQVGVWVTTGWGGVFLDPAVNARLEKLYGEWGSVSNNPALASAIKVANSLPKKVKG